MTLIHCGPPPVTTGSALALDPSPPDRRVILNVTGIERSTTSALLPETRDLLTVAAYVFLADGAIPRARKRDPLAKNWHRDLDLRIPVLQPDRWNAVRADLAEVLEFATDDSWHFEFRHGGKDEQLTLDLAPGNGASPTCVALFLLAATLFGDDPAGFGGDETAAFGGDAA